MPQLVVGVMASSRLTAEDYTQVLGPAIAAATADGGKLRLSFIFEGLFEGAETAAAWKDLKTRVSAWAFLGADRGGNRPAVGGGRAQPVCVGLA